MASWFKKYDSLTLKNPEFFNEIFKIQAEIPQLSTLENIDSPILDEKSQIWDQAIALSATEYENILQKVLIKLMNLLISFFRSEFFVQEKEEVIEFCRKSFAYTNIERKYFLSIWNKQNALHANFLMNRLLASYIRFLFFMQIFHNFLLSKREGLTFVEAEPYEIPLNYENVYAEIDCISTIFTSLLQKLSHLKHFLQNELNFLLRIYFFINYFKTLSCEQNLITSKQKFGDKDLSDLVYLILDTTKTAVVIKKNLLSTEKTYELEEEYEEDQTVRPLLTEKKEIISDTLAEKLPITLIINNETNEIPLQKLQKQRSTNAFKKPKLTKNASYFFEELNDNSDKIKENEEEEDTVAVGPLSSLNIKPANHIRKSLLGDTRNSLIAEALATEDFHKKMSKFAEIAAEKKPLQIDTPTSSTDKQELFDNSLPRSGVVRSLGETVSNFSKYLNIMNPSTSVIKSPSHDKESILQSRFFAQSMNLPSNTLLAPIHPSIIYYKGANTVNNINSTDNNTEAQETIRFPTNESFNQNIVKSMSSRKLHNLYENAGYNFYEEMPRNQKYENINMNLNEELVKYLVDFVGGDKEKSKEEGKSPLKPPKKDNKEKKMNLFVKELEGDSIFPLLTKGDEDSPKNANRRTLSGKKDKDKELRKQHTLEKEEEQQKYKRKSHKQNTKKLGITEKDLIKIDKNTEIKEKLIYSSFQEKFDEDVPRDEDILVTTLSSEADELKKTKTGAVISNSFIKSFKTKDPKEEKHIEIKEIKPHYKQSVGVPIPFFVKFEENDLENEEKLAQANKIVEEALNDMEVCEEYNDFFVFPRKNDKKFESNKSFNI